MAFGDVILLLVVVLVGLPILSYMVCKFGAAGYFRAKQRNKKEEQQCREQNEP
jgi:hypothetical protein